MPGRNEFAPPNAPEGWSHAGGQAGGSNLDPSLNQYITRLRSDTENLAGVGSQSFYTPQGLANLSQTDPELHARVTRDTTGRMSDFPFEQYPVRSRMEGLDAMERGAMGQAGAAQRSRRMPLEQVLSPLQRAETPFYEAEGAYTNPHQGRMLQALEAAHVREMQRAQRDLDAKFAGSGAYGSTRYLQANNDLHGQLEEKLLAAEAQLMHQDYKDAATIHARDADRYLQAADTRAGLSQAEQAQQWIDIENLMKVGARQREIKQAEKDFAYDQWLKEKQAPFERLNLRAAMLANMPYGVSTYKNTYQAPTRSMHSNDWQNVLLNGILKSAGGR